MMYKPVERILTDELPPVSLVVGKAIAMILSLVGMVAVPIIMRDTAPFPVFVSRPVYNNNSIGFYPDPASLVLEEYERVVPWGLPLSFFLITFVEELIGVFFQRFYWKQVQNRFVWIRWCSYMGTAPTLAWMFGYSSGIIIGPLNCAIAIMVLLCILSGYMYDYYERKQIGWLVFGFLLLLSAFLFIWGQFGHAENVPGWITGLVVALSMLYWSFGFVPVVELIGERYYAWDGRLFGEWSYMILSITAKSIFNWIYALETYQRSE